MAKSSNGMKRKDIQRVADETRPTWRVPSDSSRAVLTVTVPYTAAPPFAITVSYRPSTTVPSDVVTKTRSGKDLEVSDSAPGSVTFRIADDPEMDRSASISKLSWTDRYHGDVEVTPAGGGLPASHTVDGNQVNPMMARHADRRDGVPRDL